MNIHSVIFSHLREVREEDKECRLLKTQFLFIWANLLYSLAYMKQTVVYFVIIEIKTQKLQK